MSSMYMVSCDELIDGFEKFLQSQEGDVSAHEIAKAWNKLAKKYKWDDNLIGVDKQFYRGKEHEK